MNIDQWIREQNTRAAGWPGLLALYGLLIAAMVFSGMAMT